MNKQELRKALIEKRKSLSDEYKKSASAEICRLCALTKEIRECENVLLYSPLKDEVDTGRLFDECIRLGKRVYFPKCEENREMSFFRVKNPDKMPLGSYGIREPEGGEKIERFDRTMIIVPGIAADRKGFRLGYGGGYYDRFLPFAACAVSVGVFFSEMMENSLPRGEYDAALDIIVTEKEIIRMKGSTLS